MPKTQVTVGDLLCQDLSFDYFNPTTCHRCLTVSKAVSSGLESTPPFLSYLYVLWMENTTDYHT